MSHISGSFFIIVEEIKEMSNMALAQASVSLPVKLSIENLMLQLSYGTIINKALEGNKILIFRFEILSIIFNKV